MPVFLRVIIYFIDYFIASKLKFIFSVMFVITVVKQISWEIVFFKFWVKMLVSY